MSWVNDLASGLGIPAGAATLAVAMYAACAAAEKSARPEALKDIGRILKDTSWERSVQPSTIIDRVFKLTFGESHLSWRCAFASAYATLVFCSLFTVIITATTKRFVYGYPASEVFFHPAQALPTWTVVALITVIPDYMALGKTRLLTRSMTTDNSAALGGVMLVVLDVVLSGIISLATACVIFVAVVTALHSWYNLGNFWYKYVLNVIFPTNEISGAIYATNRPVLRSLSAVGELVVDSVLEPFGGKSSILSPFAIVFWSTMLTSIWTILILLSTAIIKLLAPLQRFTAWFFNVERNPLTAVGVVSGALVMIGSLVWTVLRAVI